MQPGPYRKIRPVESMESGDEVDCSPMGCCHIKGIFNELIVDDHRWIRRDKCSRPDDSLYKDLNFTWIPDKSKKQCKKMNLDFIEVCCDTGDEPLSWLRSEACYNIGGHAVSPEKCPKPSEEDESLVCCGPKPGNPGRPSWVDSAKYCRDHGGRVLSGFQCGSPPPSIHSEEDGCPGGVCCKSGGLPPVCTQSVKKCHRFSGHVVDDSLCSPFEDSY